MPGRRFQCSDADYLTDHDVPLHVATAYNTWYGPASIARLHALGITPDQANAERLHPVDIIAACRPNEEPRQSGCYTGRRGGMVAHEASNVASVAREITEVEHRP